MAKTGKLLEAFIWDKLGNSQSLENRGAEDVIRNKPWQERRIWLDEEGLTDHMNQKGQ